ncbi:MAG: hypothetical protein LUC44_06145 [Prevotellaceae bacterium]|nr:hypothetical protein [Prevotellaceae bacterium]
MEEDTMTMTTATAAMTDPRRLVEALHECGTLSIDGLDTGERRRVQKIVGKLSEAGRRRYATKTVDGRLVVTRFRDTPQPDMPYMTWRRKCGADIEAMRPGDTLLFPRRLTAFIRSKVSATIPKSHPGRRYATRTERDRVAVTRLPDAGRGGKDGKGGAA